MKKIYYAFVCFLLPTFIFAQAPGTFDTNFGNIPTILPGVTVIHNMEYAASIKELPDGSLIASGLYYNDDLDENSGAYLKVLPTGHIDSTFGENGFKKLPSDGFPLDIIPIDEERFLSNIIYDDSNRMEIQRRFYNSFELDSTFGENGIVSFSFSTIGYTIDLEIIEEKILILFLGEESSKLIRLNPNGDFDDSFGIGGFVNLDINYDDRPFPNLAIHEEYIFLGGYENKTILGEGVGVMKLNLSDGSLVADFGTGGHLFIPIDTFDIDGLEPISILPDGKITLIGTDFALDSGFIRILQLLPDGSFDPDFGVNGISSILIGIGADYIDAVKQIIQADGKRVIPSGDENGPFMCRLNTDGSLDTGFGENGIARYGTIEEYAYYTDIIYSATTQSYYALGTDYDICFINKIHTDQIISTQQPRFNPVEISVFPNPTVQSFNVSFLQEKSQTFDIQLLTLDGKIIESLFHGYASKGNFEQILQLKTTVPTGNYIILVQTEDAILRKLIQIVRR